MNESHFKKRLEKYLEGYKTNCEKFKTKQCEGFNCRCQKRAEVWSYIDEIVPEQYIKLTIDDFTGMFDNNRQLSPEVVSKAKNIIKSYCWEGLIEGEDYDREWLKKSVLQKRKDNCNNLIIHGSSWTTVGNNSKLIHRKTGRTMLASIVMSQVIMSRGIPPFFSDSYGWINYNVLSDKLMSRANDNHEYDYDLSELEEADWLVIDEIRLGKDHNKSFRASVLDRFLNKRIENRRPTILVFNEDIEKMFNFTEEFGYVAEKIIQSNSTFKVHLI